MPSTDDRIVRMEFDNASFERKISSTLTSLAQLDKALKFTGASKGLSDVSDAADKVNFNGMSNGLEDVSKKFIALSTIAITALVNITERAIQAGAQVAKSLTIQPIVDGFREYETQLNSVQTILANTASKGTTLDQVNAALQQLNTYSDQTIYNFGQMARNIGTFTAAGVDLNTSVSAIKGIANLAAMSGSNADQAATAMYQLSQAIASGSVKLMDWNSVVNAGMGGEAFKSALFETGKAMHTLTDVPLSQTMKQWEDSGHSFRDSLQDGWITADVLTTTLAGFTGDLTEEMLVAKGFSEEAAQNILKTAAIAKAAATEVKTFTQLVGTVKEAVGSGWTESFQLIIGNFNQAKELWTGVNNSIGAFVQKNADARNAVLAGWELFGGRTKLIDSLKIAFQDLFAFLKPIQEAFRNIFPPTTAVTLLELTDRFHAFVESMKPGQILIDKLRIIFQGFFAALSIGWEILSEGTKFVAGLAKSLLKLVTPEASDFLVKLGLGLSNLQAALVKGGGIKDFFEGLTRVLEKPLAFLVKVKEAIGSIFDRFNEGLANKVSDSVDRVGSRFDNLKQIFDRLGDIWKPLENALSKIVDVLGRVWDYMVGWVKELGSNLAKVMGPGDFNAFLDAINTGLLGGIVLLLRKFFKEGMKIDLGGGFFGKLSGILDQVTGSLKAMQMNVKANALLKIASAIAILTASVLVLSMIDSAALTRALGAMAVGFGELMATFSAFTKIASTPTSALSFTILSAGLIMLSTALLILSGVVSILGKMSLKQLAKGLGAITAILAILVAAAFGLGKASGSMIAAGVGITAMAVGLAILAIPMKVFSKMSWEEIGKGLVVVAGFLLAVAGAMQLMPATLPITAAGLILVAVALIMLMAPMKVFSKMKWEEIGKGLAAIAGALLIIAAAMQLMPTTLPITAAGLILVGIALTEIAGAMKIMATMSWEEIGKGLTVMAGALIILSGAMLAMSGTIFGSLALIIAAEALLVLAAALKVFGKMSFDSILDALLKVALALGAFALIALALQPAIGAMLALGAALVVLGIGFALVGAGAYLVAKAFETFAKAGDAGIKMLGEFIDLVAEKLPQLARAVSKSIVASVLVFAKAAPVLAKSLIQFLNAILDELPTLIPKVLAIIGQLISGVIQLIRDKYPEYVAAGLFMLTSLLEGIRDNIENIVAIVASIVVKFLDELSKQLDGIVDSVINLYINLMLKVAEGLGRVAGTLLFGIGEAFIKGFMEGVSATAESGPMKWFLELPGKVLSWIGDVISTLWQKGTDFITGLFEGITSTAWNIIVWFTQLPGNVVNAVGNVLKTLFQKGKDILQGFWDGLINMIGQVLNWIGDIAGWAIREFPNPLDVLYDIGKKIMHGLWNGLKDVWHEVTGWLSDLNPANWFNDINLPKGHAAKNMLPTGLAVMGGLQYGMQEGWKDLGVWVSKLNPADLLGDDFDMSPVITPVLDLTQIRAGANELAGYIPASSAFSHAQIIATQRTDEAEHIAMASQSGDVNFQQIINAPTKLSTSDIYKQTRNQITIAKEELSIP